MPQQPCHANVDSCDGGHLWLRQISSQPHRIIKTRHCISGCDRVVPSGLCCTTPHFHGTTALSLFVVIADLTRNFLRSRGVFFQNILFQHYTRRQTTTNDYCRLQTFNQRLSLGKWFSFATNSLKQEKWTSYNKERLGRSSLNSKENQRRPSGSSSNSKKASVLLLCIVTTSGTLTLYGEK